MSFCFNIFNLKTITIFTTIILIFSFGNSRNVCNENSICTNEIINISNPECVKNVNYNNQNIVITSGENNNFIDNAEVWKLEIPKINLVADIAEGTTYEILNHYIGHFEETQMLEGNVGLAAHNRGYNVNYFARLKELEIGDCIFYTYNGIAKRYVVNCTKIIRDTELEVLENTEENRLTLITCVENKPELRRCIQAIEKN